MLEVSHGDISSMNISGVEEDIKIISEMFDNLTVCKESYSYFYSNIGCSFQTFLEATREKHIENIEKDLAPNLYFINLKNEHNAENIMRVFGKFFFTFPRFPGTINHLPLILMGETPSFVKENDIISPSRQYQNFNYGDTRGLVSVHVLADLNIYFGGNRALPKAVMREFFHNLSMQAWTISDDSVVLKLDAIKKLNKNMNDLINSNIPMQKKGAVISGIQHLDPPTIVGDEPTFNNKISSIIVNEF